MVSLPEQDAPPMYPKGLKNHIAVPEGTIIGTKKRVPHRKQHPVVYQILFVVGPASHLKIGQLFYKTQQQFGLVQNRENQTVNRAKKVGKIGRASCRERV